jgi:asparagine synthase (glutamine-hydrolysing)
MSLTGGLDSRLIMAWLKPDGRSLPCYTFAGMIRDCQDAIVARQVAGVCGQPHQIIRVGGDFLARFSAYAERTVYLTDGCAEVSRAADLYVNEAARLIAPVRMTGNYGGEVLRRVRAFKPVEPVSGLFSAELHAAMRDAQRTYARHVHGHPLSFAVFRQAPGITTGCSRWNRHSFRCARPTSTRTCSAPSSAPHRQPAPTTRSASA